MKLERDVFLIIKRLRTSIVYRIESLKGWYTAISKEIALQKHKGVIGNLLFCVLN